MGAHRQLFSELKDKENYVFSYDSKHAKLLKAIANDPDTPFTLREVFEDPALGQASQTVGLDGLKTKTNPSGWAPLKNTRRAGESSRWRDLSF